MKKFCKRAYLALILIFLYLPIIVLIVQSFNAGKSRAKWEGFSFRWYTELFQDTRIMNALTVTVTIALLAMVVATILGTLAAIGIHAEGLQADIPEIFAYKERISRQLCGGVESLPLHEGRPRLCDDAAGAHHVRYALRHPIGAAEAQANEPTHLRSGA